MIVASLSDNEITSEIPENFLNLPYMYSFKMPYYDNYNVKTPSILKSLKLINDYEPDQIIISTPGPIGLLGLLAARLIGIPMIGIYHTDFYGEANYIVKDESASRLVLEYEKWFYSQMTEIRTPTKEYQRILADRDLSVSNVQLLRRGIDLELYIPRPQRKKWLQNRDALQGGITLLYAGRISLDKSLDLLVDVYKQLLEAYPELNLIVAGNGPYLSEMKELLAGCSRVLFTGAVPRQQLAPMYNAAELSEFDYCLW